MSLRNVPIDMVLNHSVIPIRPAGGAWSSARDYARYVRLELARGRLPDGSTFATEKNLLARRIPQVRVGEDSWYGMGLWIEDVKGIRVISHGGSMFGDKSNFFFVLDAGVGGVILTNADSGSRVATAVMRRTLEVLYDGQPEAEENLLSGVRETQAFLTGEQRDWKVPPEPSAVQRLARSYRNAALGEIVVREGQDEIVFQFGGWKSRMASRVNPDGTTSFLSIDPGVRGFEFNAPTASGVYTRLRLRDAQHTYEYQSSGGGGRGPAEGGDSGGEDYTFSARIATTPASWRGATGFSRWYWNPARKMLARCSGPMTPVRAAAGVAPPRSGGRARTWRMSQ
jgi:Beta-lactamase